MANQAQAGGTQQQGYDPTNPTPYQAYQPPEAAPPRPSPMQPQNPGFQFSGAPISKLGAVAGTLDNVLRGVMAGKAQHAEKVANEFKTKTANLQASHAQDVQRLDGMMRAGVDPTSEEFKTAKAAADGSWSALMDWSEKVAVGPDGDKKPKKSKKKPDQPQTPQGGPFGQPPQSPQQQMQDQKKQEMQQLYQDAQSTDPKVKVAALWKIRKLMGPAINYQVKQYESPEYQAQLKATKDTQGVEAQTQLPVAQNKLAFEQAQATINQIAKTPQSQWTPAVREQYEQAYNIVNPPKPAAAPKPGEGVLTAADEIAAKIQNHPGYKLTPDDHQILRMGGFEKDASEKRWYNPKTGAVVESLDDGTVKVTQTKTGSGAGTGGSGGAGGKGMDGAYQHALDYYRKWRPDMPPEEQESLAHRKAEGASQQQAGSIAHDAVAEPKQFDNEVISLAIANLRGLPQYKDPAMLKKLSNGLDTPSLDEMLSNIVGQGELGYQYHDPAWVNDPEHKAGKDGKYAGGINEDGLKSLERDLQAQIRAVISGSKETAITPEARRAFVSRTQPVFIKGSTTTPVLANGSGATPAPGASSPPAPGGNSGGPKVGDIVTVRGKKVKITSIDANGNASGEQVP